MTTTQTVSSEELLSRTADLIPLISAKADATEENRRIDGEVLEAIAAAGVLDMRRPVRYGGLESDARTLSQVLETLARGDGSTSWTVSAWLISTWIACVFPDHVQDEVFSTPNARVCAVLSPSAVASHVRGGLTVTGRWQFISGAQDAHWQVVLALAPTPDGSTMWPVMALVPMSDLTVIDDWYTSGLCGTGSVATAAQDLFVPAERVLPLPFVLQGQYASEANASSPVFSAPLMPMGCAGFVGVGVGLARAAVDAFLTRLPGRKITYSDYTAQDKAPITHLEVSEAVYKADEADFHARRVTDLLDSKAASGEAWKVEDRVLARASLGRSFQLVRESVDVLASASGGSSIYRGVPMQRILRDVHALSMHSLMHPSTNAELYGRVLCGQEPNSVYL